MQTTTGQYKYYAFVSYSSKDMKWGRLVQRRLEHYRIPAEAGCDWTDKHMRPIFFAPTDIQPGALSDELQHRLEQSQHLIVIGSPNSARSEWVGREIEFFHRLGRTANIHYFLVSKDDPQECYHPVLKQLGLPELLGANIHEHVYRWPWLNRERAFVQLISKLLGVEFDSVWRRHRRQLIRRAVIWVLACVAFIAALAGVWMKSQPFDATVELQEASVHNVALPPLRDAVVVIALDNEEKSDTLSTLSSSATFTNIPSRFLGQSVRIRVAADDWTAVDTTLELTRHTLIPLHRDPKVYGDINFTLWDPHKECTVTAPASILGMPLTPDTDGRLRLQVPLERQQTKYKVSTTLPLENDTLYMPRGENDVLVVKRMKN